jgi:hypothetical protein
MLEVVFWVCYFIVGLSPIAVLLWPVKKEKVNDSAE